MPQTTDQQSSNTSLLTNPRAKIIEIAPRNSNKQTRQHNPPNEDLSNPRQYPLEMQPVLDAVIDYSKRTFSLGILMGQKELDDICSYIVMNLDVNNAQISQLINYIQDRSKIFKETFIKGYEQ